MLRPVLRVDKKTGEVLERFESIAEAQAVEGLDVYSQCRERALCKRSMYCYRFEDDFDPSESWEGKKNRPVHIVDLETGRIGWAVDMAEAAKVLAISECSVKDSVYRGRTVVGRYRMRLQRRLGEWALLKERIENEVPQG